jgi:cytochrome oxidase Cu insertion factor (SCO1/SenC/PrrC family)
MAKWIAIGLGGLVVAVYVVLSIMAGSPKDAIQMVRYALPYMHRGNLHVGDNAPDVTLVALDGASTFQLRAHLQGKPLVLVFGSFT